MSIIKTLSKKCIIRPPQFLSENIHYETMMGSVAYGVSSEKSDIDLYGFCIPPKDFIFPHLRGEIPGFGTPGPRFEQYQQHHIQDHETQYDIAIYSIVKYFQLCMQNNPNMIDSLFTPLRCVRHATQVGHLVREHRKLFLHKGCWHTFRGYAWAQLHKMESQQRVGSRKDIIERYGYDVKFAYHVVRLISEVEQLLTTGDLDREVLKAIRRGEWSLEKIKVWFSEREVGLQTLYEKSSLPASPREEEIKNLLLSCLEYHYGHLSEECVVITDKATLAMREVRSIVDKYGF